MRLNSLAFRLFATAALWTLVALPLAGLIIFSLYRQEVDSSFDERIKTLLLVVYTDSSDHAQGEPGAPRDVGEPLFEITHSGWYWQIKPTRRRRPAYARLQVARQRDAALALREGPAARRVRRPLDP